MLNFLLQWKLTITVKDFLEYLKGNICTQCGFKWVYIMSLCYWERILLKCKVIAKHEDKVTIFRLLKKQRWLYYTYKRMKFRVIPGLSQGHVPRYGLKQVYDVCLLFTGQSCFSYSFLCEHECRKIRYYQHFEHFNL